MKLIQNIFSIKNENDKKILKLFGIKIKFTNVKYMLFENNAILKENNILLKDLKKRVAMLDIPLNYKKYWTEDNLQNIIPLNQGKYPEGFNPADIINKDVLKDIKYEKILDFGCGYGRLSDGFDSDKYLGVDLNPNAIIAAKNNNPNYQYNEVDLDSPYPACDVVFAHTVFLHNDDKNLSSILNRLKETGCEYIVISDIISKDWHNGFVPPTYFRSVDDYNILMQKINFSFVFEKKYTYKRYAEAAEYKHLNTDISFLLYKKES